VRRVFVRQTLERLARFSRSKVLLAFDFDGTLAPIVENRDLALMRAGTTQLFRELCRLYPCAVISGRSKADVESRLADARVRQVIGNHGLEPGHDLREFAREVAHARQLLQLSLAHCSGVEVEDKSYSLAIHYRKSREKRKSRAAIHEVVAALQRTMRVVPGKLVWNLVPARAAHKGDALLLLQDQEAAETAFYVGDDVTDEDVFLLDRPDQLFTVRVGRSKKSAAQYYLSDQREIDSLLTKLVELRTETPP